MLPERAFQPRGPYGMTLEGGGGGIVDAIGDVFEGVVEAVEDVGRYIDDKIIQPVLEDPVEAVVTAAAYYYGGPIGAGAAKTAFELDDGKELDEALESGAKTAAAAYAGQQVFGAPTGGTEGSFGGGWADFSDEVYQGASGAAPSATGTTGGLLGGGAELASVGETMAPTPGVSPAPVIEATPVSTNPIRFPGVEVQPTYTPSPGSFQEALPGLGVETQATTAPYTALPGTFQAATAATTGGLLSTPAAPSTISVQQAIRGAQLANQLLNPQRPQVPNLLGQAQQALAQQGGVDYSTLLGLLSQRAIPSGLLGTRFQPQPINLVSLLG
jgi:hypothetical protein